MSYLKSRWILDDVVSAPNSSPIVPWRDAGEFSVPVRLRLENDKVLPFERFEEEVTRLSPGNAERLKKKYAMVGERLRFDQATWDKDEWSKMLLGGGDWKVRTLLLCRAMVRPDDGCPEQFFFALPDGQVISSKLLWWSGKGGQRRNPLLWIPDWVTIVGLEETHSSQLKNDTLRATALTRWFLDHGASPALLSLNGANGAIHDQNVRTFREKYPFLGSLQVGTSESESE